MIGWKKCSQLDVIPASFVRRPSQTQPLTFLTTQPLPYLISDLSGLSYSSSCFCLHFVLPRDPLFGVSVADSPPPQLLSKFSPLLLSIRGISALSPSLCLLSSTLCFCDTCFNRSNSGLFYIMTHGLTERPPSSRLLVS